MQNSKHAVVAAGLSEVLDTGQGYVADSWTDNTVVAAGLSEVLDTGQGYVADSWTDKLAAASKMCD